MRCEAVWRVMEKLFQFAHLHEPYIEYQTLVCLILFFIHKSQTAQSLNVLRFPLVFPFNCLFRQSVLLVRMVRGVRIFPLYELVCKSGGNIQLIEIFSV